MVEDGKILVQNLIFAFLLPKALHFLSIYYLMLMSFDNGYVSHTDEILSARQANPFKTCLGRWMSHLLALCLFGGILATSLMYSLNTITLSVLVIAYLGTSILMLVLFIILEVLKSKAFSGLPYLNDDKRRRSKAIKTRLLLFLLGKTIDSGVGIFLLFDSLLRNEDFEDWVAGNSWKGYLLYMAQGILLFVCEVVPVYKSLQKRFTRFMSRDGNHHDIQLIVESQAKIRTFFASSLQSKDSSKDSSPSKDGRYILATTDKISLDMLGLNPVFEFN